MGFKSRRKVARSRRLINKAGRPHLERPFDQVVTMASTAGRWSGERSSLRWLKTLKCRRQRKASGINVASDPNVATNKSLILVIHSIVRLFNQVGRPHWDVFL